MAQENKQQVQQKQKEEQKVQHKVAEQHKEQHLLKCPNCGASYTEQDMYCSECGVCLHGSRCSHCGADVKPGLELCPVCGKPLGGDHCTFCGAEMDSSMSCCPECGNPREGIICPDCHTLNFRSFCRTCNRPLNQNALMAVEQAKRDPHFQRVVHLNEELAELEEYLHNFKEQVEQAMAEDELDAQDMEQQLSDEGATMMAKYEELLGLLQKSGGAPAPQAKAEQKAAPKRHQRKTELKAKFVDAAQMMRAYQAKAAEMQQLLEQIIPDPSLSVQLQRDFVSARKVPQIKNVTKQHQYWVCNLCGCEHNQPSECADPSLGGVWIYRTEEYSVKTFEYIDE